MAILSSGVVCFLFCFGTVGPVKETPPIETYCKSYVRVVKSKEELDQILKLPRKLRDRIQGNDLDYLCRCKKAKLSACGSTAR